MQVLIHFINLSKFGSFSNINVLKKNIFIAYKISKKIKKIEVVNSPLKYFTKQSTNVNDWMRTAELQC